MFFLRLKHIIIIRREVGEEEPGHDGDYKLWRGIKGDFN